MSNDDITTIIILIIIVLVLILPNVFLVLIQNSDCEIKEILIKDKYVKGEHGEYMIVDMNNTTYRVSYKKCDEIYNRLEIGKTYKAKIKGKRIQILDMFKCIYDIEEVKESDK